MWSPAAPDGWLYRLNTVQSHIVYGTIPTELTQKKLLLLYDFLKEVCPLSNLKNS